jgi:homogentisate 1,2-dioxygenase
MPIYNSGFHNYIETQAIEGSLPKDQNSPQNTSMGLFPEQINNSAFTAPKAHNFKTWQYRIRPSVLHFSEPKLVIENLIRDIYHNDKIFYYKLRF